MLNIKELYIHGEPIETPIGNCHFLLVKDYPKLVPYMELLTLDKEILISNVRKHGYVFADELEKNQFIDIIKNDESDNPNIPTLGQLYDELFLLFFKENDKEIGIVNLINTDEELEIYLNLIKEMNDINIEKPNPNPEIERFNQMKRLMEKSRGESITHETIYTSIWVGMGVNPKELTLYQFNKLFNRLVQFKNYDTSILFATVSEKPKIEAWYKDLSIKEDNRQFITEEQLKRKSQKSEKI